MYETSRVSETKNESEYVDILLALKAIQKRSKGLLSFVETYRNLTKIQNPVIHEIALNNFFLEIIILMNSDLQSSDEVLRGPTQLKS